MSPSRISHLAKVIAERTATVDKNLIAHELPALSFEADGPKKSAIPAHEKDIVAAKDDVIASKQQQHNRKKGPDKMLMGLGVSV